MAEPTPIDDLTDLSTFPLSGGIGFSDLPIRGPRVPLEWVVRSWFGFIVWGSEAPVDVRDLENADLTPTELQVWRGRLATRARAVDYVAACSVEVTADEGDVEVRGVVTLVNGISYPLAVSLGEAGKAVVSFAEAVQ